MNNYYYSFPALKGIQAKESYYICMIPLSLLNKLFSNDNESIEPEFRAQRKLNLIRIPEIKNYILSNRNSYVFSALCASFDGNYKFETTKNSNIGILNISMDATFLINDGQHRKAAIKDAIDEDPSLKDETIPVVMFIDKGLTRSQQMFTDLNKHAVNTTKSINALYDSNDPLSVLTKKVVSSNKFLNRYTDKERDNLGKYSSCLFTLNNLLIANKNMLRGINLDKNIEIKVIKFWENVVENIYEFKELENRSLNKVELREKYIITQGVTLNAFGNLGNYFLSNNINNFDILKKLKTIDWKRTNSTDWFGVAINKKGKIVKNSNSVKLTYIKIKQLLDLNVTESDKLYLRRNKLN